MNIGFNTFALSEQKTGAGVYITKLIEYLAQIDKQNNYKIFLNKNNKGHFTYLNQPNFQKIDCGFLTAIRPLRLIWEHFNFPKIINTEKIELLHSPAFVAPANISCKSIITIFDMTFFLFPEKHSKTKYFYFKSLMPKSIEAADAIITISENSKKDIVDYFKIDPEKVKVTYLAADRCFKPIRDQQSLFGIKNKYSIVNDFILFTGVLEPRKNIVRLIKAFNILKQDQKINEQLVIVGKKGWGYQSLFDLVKELKLEDSVIFTGYVTEQELVLLYNAAKIFVYPSLYEGFGLPVIEAMACGTPVVTSKSSSLEEIAGNNCILIDPKKEADIAAAIFKLLNDKSLRDNYSELGSKRAEFFSWDKTARQTLEVYRNL